MSKTLSVRPSTILKLNQWAEQRLGVPDWWTAYQFDNAVLQFGMIIENRLAETEDYYVNGNVQRRLKYDTVQAVFDEIERKANRARGDVLVDYLDSFGMVVQR